MKKLLAAMFVALLMVGCGGDVEIPKLIKCNGCGIEVSSSGEVCMDCSHPIADSVEAYFKEQKLIAGAIDYEKMEVRGEVGEALYYVRDQQTPYTGWVKGGVGDNGQIGSLSQYKDGKLDGLLTWWYFNGQKQLEETYKDSKIVTAVAWKPNGEKCPVTNVVNGNGVVVWYNEDGTEDDRRTYKDGVKVED